MTDCPNGDVRDLLPDLLHDRLSPDVRRDVEGHVWTCADCTRELALLRAMRSSLRRVPAVNAAAIATAIPAYRAPVRRSWVGWRAAAAIMILAAGGTSVAVFGRSGVVVVDSAVGGPTASAPLVPEPARSAPAAPIVAAAPATSRAATRELAMGSGVIGELNDGELSALLKDLETVDVIPSVDVENATAVSPIAPAGTE